MKCDIRLLEKGDLVQLRYDTPFFGGAKDLVFVTGINKEANNFEYYNFRLKEKKLLSLVHLEFLTNSSVLVSSDMKFSYAKLLYG